MELHKEPIVFAWPGGFPRREVPDAVLYDVRLRFRHNGATPAAQVLEQALSTFGAVQVRRLPLVAPRVRVRGGRIGIDGIVGKDHVDVRLDQRVKGNLLGRIVEALSAVPGARDLQIDAQAPKLKAAYSSLRACTPCQAKTFR